MDSAILKQKLEFLEIQLEDSCRREADLQRMYDSMLDSLGPSATDQVSHELSKERERFEKEQVEIQAKLNAQLKLVETEARELRDNLQDAEYRLRTQRLTSEEQLMKTRQGTFLLQTEKKQLELKLKALEEDDSHLKIVNSLEAKIDLLTQENEALKADNQRELQEARDLADRAVVELKKLCENLRCSPEEVSHDEVKKLKIQVQSLE
jgi:uncharacterized protein YaaQ